MNKLTVSYNISKPVYETLRHALRKTKADETLHSSGTEHDVFQISTGVVMCKMNGNLEAILLANGLTNVNALKTSFDDFVERAKGKNQADNKHQLRLFDEYGRPAFDRYSTN